MLYFCINCRSSITLCFCSGDIYLSLGISLSSSFVTVSELLCSEFFEILVIISANLLPIKSLVASGVVWITLLEVVLSASITNCLAWSGSF